MLHTWPYQLKELKGKKNCYKGRFVWIGEWSCPAEFMQLDPRMTSPLHELHVGVHVDVSGSVLASVICPSRVASKTTFCSQKHQSFDDSL